jgi:hypothetical protein
MRQVVQTTETTETLAPVPMDQYISPFNVSVAITTLGNCTTTTQYTFDDVFSNDFDALTAEWFDHPDLTNVADDQVGNFAFPVKAIRLNVTSNNPGNKVTFYVTQAGTN